MGQTSSGHVAPRASPCNNLVTNNLPPVTFHQVHGDNIRLSRDATIAHRAESFCKGIAFSARPIKVNEKIFIKFIEIANNWSGVIRFGFTANDPNDSRYALPKYACPDLTNKPGNWAKALAERFCELDTTLFYYVTAHGDVHFGINGEEKGVFFSGVETKTPLWALLDVYGNSTAIEFVDIRRGVVPRARGSTNVTSASPTEEIVAPMHTLNLRNEGLEQDLATGHTHTHPMLRYQPSVLTFRPVPLHRTRGRNIRFSCADRCVAARMDSEFCQGYVFTARPLTIGERVVVQILNTESLYVGALAFGLTSCDPSKLRMTDLPDDSDLLLDRPEYWVVSKDVVSTPQKGDEIAFYVTADGEVRVSKNGGAGALVMHVDQTLTLWAFLDVYGSTQKIRVLSTHAGAGAGTTTTTTTSDGCLVGSNHTNQSNHSNQSNSLNHVTQSNSSNHLNSSNSSNHLSNSSQHVDVRRSATIQAIQQTSMQHQPSVLQIPNNPGSTVLVLNLPSASSNASIQASGTHLNGSSAFIVQQPSMDVSRCVKVAGSSSLDSIRADSSVYDAFKGVTTTSHGPSGVECTICYENSIDSVLYMCGHMCMCYECAIHLWRVKDGGHCPLCRAEIKDVIRIYKS